MKRFIKSTIIITAATLILVAASSLLIDPVFHYHMPLFGLKTIVPEEGQSEMYYVAGMADRFDYDTAIVGTSMSENFRASWFDKTFGFNTVKLTVSGACSKEYLQVLDRVIAHDGTENIVMNIDKKYLFSTPGVGRWDSFPDHLYDDDITNDFSYLLNKKTVNYSNFPQGNVA